MAFALTRFDAYGVERDEPLVKRFIQRLELRITAANTDVDLDIGDFSGTFWTAVGPSSTIGALGIKALKDIQRAASAFLWVAGTGLTGKTQVSADGGGNVVYTSAAGAGGGILETFTVTGLGATDTILAVSQSVAGSNGLPLLGYNTQAANSLKGDYSADPGAGSIIKVDVRKAAGSATVITAGQYSVALDGTNTKLPNILFASGNAPTALDIVLEWEFNDGQSPIRVLQTA